MAKGKEKKDVKGQSGAKMVSDKVVETPTAKKQRIEKQFVADNYKGVKELFKNKIFVRMLKNLKEIQEGKDIKVSEIPKTMTFDQIKELKGQADGIGFTIMFFESFLESAKEVEKKINNNEED